MDMQHAFNLIALLVLLLVFYRVVKSDDNDLEFWHLLSTRSADGKVYVDNEKVGQLVGLLFGTWIVCWLAYTGKLEILYFAVWLLYASGMGAFSKWARAMIADRYGRKGKRPEEKPQ